MVFSFGGVFFHSAKLCLRFIHVIACINSSFVFTAGKYSIMWIYHGLFIHSSIDGHLGCFQFLAVKNKPVINIFAQVFGWTFISFSFW